LTDTGLRVARFSTGCDFGSSALSYLEPTLKLRVHFTVKGNVEKCIGRPARTDDQRLRAADSHNSCSSQNAAAVAALPLSSDLLFLLPPRPDTDFTMKVSSIARSFYVAAKVIAIILVILAAVTFVPEALVVHSWVPDSWVPTAVLLFLQDKPFTNSLLLLPENAAAFFSSITSVADSDAILLLTEVSWTCLVAAFRILFDKRSSSLIKIYSFPARIVTALSSVGLLNYWKCKGFTIALSVFIPFIPIYGASVVAYIAGGLLELSSSWVDADQAFFVPLLLNVSATALLCAFVPRRIVLGLIAIRSLYYFAVGSFVLYMIYLHEEETKLYKASFLWVVMSANVALFYFADEDETKTVALKAGICCSLWAVIWTLPQMGEPYFDYMIF
jgi:hypothetical protein